MNNDGTYQWAPNDPGSPKKKFKNIGKTLLIAAIIIFVAIGTLTCFYTVDDKQQAVVTTFGKVTDITDAGLHIKLPFGIQQVYKVDSNVYQKIELGYASSGSSYTVNTSESTMITGDYNIVNVDFFVEYRISDPVQYLYSSNDPELILKNLIQSQIRNVVGSSTVDAVLTDGKENIQMQVKDLVSQILSEYDIGLTLVDVRIQDAEPPTAEVLAAFKDVENAKQGKDTALNNANKYRSEQIPAAEAEADQILRQAEAAKESRINEATGQVARFNAMYEEYSKFPGITKQRMYFEAMEELLPGIQVILTDENGNHLNMFNFDAAKEETAE